MSGAPRLHSAARPAWSGGWGETARKIAFRLGTGQTVALLGPRGPGKTQMGVAIIRTACARGMGARYARAMDVFMAVRATYSHPEKTEREVVDYFCEPRLLVIDEMHERGNTAWERQMLTHIVDKRHADLLDTVLVGNQREDGFIEAVGSSVAERIRERGGIIDCDWGSFRQ